MLCDGPRETRLAHLDKVPLVRKAAVASEVETTLAAAAAAWRLGVPLELVRIGLESFVGTTAETPGRVGLPDLEGASIVIK